WPDDTELAHLIDFTPPAGGRCSTFDLTYSGPTYSGSLLESGFRPKSLKLNSEVTSRGTAAPRGVVNALVSESTLLYWNELE
ncbi:hypothetical protein AVEN_132261-1, partial [Araneus ventricosus]